MADDDDLNPHEWEKPAWATDGPGLKATGKADKMKGQGNLAGEITMINANKAESRDINSAGDAGDLNASGGGEGQDLSWEKPAWAADAGLKSTGKGDKMKTRGDLAKPITFPKGKN